MRRLLAVFVIAIALLAANAFAQRTQISTQVNGLNITAASNGDVTFQTFQSGDSLWAVHSRFDLPGDLDKEWPNILATWRATNPSISQATHNWLFTPGRTYTVPPKYVEAFLYSAGITQPTREDPKNTLDAKAAKAVPAISADTAPIQPPATTQSGLSWVAFLLGAIVALSVGMLIGRRLKFGRHQREKLDMIEEAINRHNTDAQMYEDARRLTENERTQLEREREAVREFDNPVDAGPAIEPINRHNPDLAAITNERFKEIAEETDSDAFLDDEPVSLQVFRYNDATRTLEPTGEEVVVADIDKKAGPTYRGNVDGHLRVRFGDDAWRNCRGNGEPAYWSMFAVTTDEGETKEVPLVFIEACGNDVRFRGGRYRTDNRIVNCEMIEGTQIVADEPTEEDDATTQAAEDEGAATGADAQSDPASSDTQTASYGATADVSDSTQVDPATADPQEEVKTTPSVQRVLWLMTTPYANKYRRAEDIYELVNGSADRAATLDLVLKYKWLPVRKEHPVTMNPTFTMEDMKVAEVRLPYQVVEASLSSLEEVLFGALTGRELPTLSAMILRTIDSVEDRTIKVVLISTHIEAPMPPMEIDASKVKPMHHRDRTDVVFSKPDLFAQTVYVAQNGSPEETAAWIAKHVDGNANEREALIAAALVTRDKMKDDKKTSPDGGGGKRARGIDLGSLADLFNFGPGDADAAATRSITGENGRYRDVGFVVEKCSTCPAVDSCSLPQAREYRNEMSSGSRFDS